MVVLHNFLSFSGKVTMYLYSYPRVRMSTLVITFKTEVKKKTV